MPSSIVRPDTDGVFPHSVYASPFNVGLFWTNTADDVAGAAALDNMLTQFTAVLKADGQPVSSMAIYPNYADVSYTNTQMYGANLPRAVALRKSIDPNGVMLRTGGWKFV